MSQTLVNMRDIRFVLYEMLDVEQVTKYEYYSDHSRETFDIALDSAYKLAKEVFWPAYSAMDKQGVSLDTAGRKTTVPREMQANAQIIKNNERTAIDFREEWF